MATTTASNSWTKYATPWEAQEHAAKAVLRTNLVGLVSANTRQAGSWLHATCQHNGMATTTVRTLFGLSVAGLNQAIGKVNAQAKAQPYLQAILLVNDLDPAGSPGGIERIAALIAQHELVLEPNVCLLVIHHDAQFLIELGLDPIHLQF